MTAEERAERIIRGLFSGSLVPSEVGWIVDEIRTAQREAVREVLDELERRIASGEAQMELRKLRRERLGGGERGD